MASLSKHPKNILVLSGGWSPERPVSLRSGQAVEKALQEAGYRTLRADPNEKTFARRMLTLRGKADIAFIALHGPGGEDGVIQGFLEVLGLPYTGSGVMASAVTMDKEMTKEHFVIHGIPTPKYEVVWRGEEPRIGWKGPVVVKPNVGGSTIGVTVVKSAKSLEDALRTAWKYDDEALVEDFILGQELTVGVVNGKALPVIEIIPKTAFYDYKAKYTPGMSAHLIPPTVSTRLQVEAQRLAVRAHAALKCQGATRTDFRCHVTTQKLYAMEINTMPGCTGTSLLPEAARAAGMSFPTLVDEMVKEAWQRHLNNKKRGGR